MRETKDVSATIKQSQILCVYIEKQWKIGQWNGKTHSLCDWPLRRLQFFYGKYKK